LRIFNLIVVTLLSLLLIVSCASSEVSRDAASNVDMGVKNAKNMADGMSSGDIADSYQNSSQAAKGAIIGGSAGAVTGSMASGIGGIAGAVVGAVMGASYGSYIDSNASLQDQLINRGANIIVLGDQVLVVIPSARIFAPYTSNIKPSAYSTLDNLADYINKYDKTLVKISAYTNKFGSKDSDLALSQQQANNVSKYLTRSGVDARVRFAEGYGATHFVSNVDSEWGEGDNYRIEITLEKLPA
jgi:outer membrane protein OmpA-like peptidoglycan-associated protein